MRPDAPACRGSLHVGVVAAGQAYMFGLFKKKGGPSPEDVMAHARAAVLAHRPATGIEERGLALALTVGQRQVVWNLHDVARLAPEDPEWKAGVESMARKVVERLGSSDFG